MTKSKTSVRHRQRFDSDRTWAQYGPAWRGCPWLPDARSQPPASDPPERAFPADGGSGRWWSRPAQVPPRDPRQRIAEAPQTRTTPLPHRGSDRLNHCCTKYVRSMIPSPTGRARSPPSRSAARLEIAGLTKEPPAPSRPETTPADSTARTSQTLHATPNSAASPSFAPDNSINQSGREQRTCAEFP